MTTSGNNSQGFFKTEMALWFGIATTIVFLVFGPGLLGDLSHTFKFSILFVWLFCVMLWLSFGVVRHADCLAVILGEPYGTMILTLSVISIEAVMIGTEGQTSISFVRTGVPVNNQ